MKKLGLESDFPPIKLKSVRKIKILSNKFIYYFKGIW